MKENRSVIRILEILELVSKHPEGLTLGQIYRMLDIPKATAYDFLQTLYQADAVYYKDPRLKNYVIGSKMFSIGSVYTKNSSFVEAAELDLKNFAHTYGHTVTITKRIQDRIVYVYKFQPPTSRVVIPYEIGSTITDFDLDVIGKCFKMYDHHLSGSRDVDHKLNQIVMSSGEEMSHIATIACPVWNFENRCVGVIAASDLTNNGPVDQHMIDEFIRIAKSVSHKLGFIQEK